MNNDVNVEEKEFLLSAEEREYVFGGSVADDFFTLDINKCRTFNHNIEVWRNEATKNPDNVKLQYEDAYHIIFKVKRNCVQFPKPKSKKDLTDEQRQQISERMKTLHKNVLTKK